MKITVELDDFWIEEGELNSTLSAEIKRSVISQITKSIQDKVDTEITKKVEKVVSGKIASVIDMQIADCVNSGEIIVNKVPVAIKTHVQNLFNSNIGWNNPRDQIVRLANDFGKQLKAQYDAAFANRIVIAIREQGMLKDEVVQMLLENK